MKEYPGNYKAVVHLHTRRSTHWKYKPLERFAIPDCYVSTVERVRDYASSGMDAIFITDHDTPLVLDDRERQEIARYLDGNGKRFALGSGEEVTVLLPQGGLEVLILYRGLDPYRDRRAIWTRHREIHRHTHDAFEFFRYIRKQDDLIDILAHPFAGPLRMDAVSFYRLLKEGLIVRVEAFCGGEATREQNRYAYQLARALNLGMTASDDKHSRFGGLRSYTWSSASDLDGFLDDLTMGRTEIYSRHKPTYPRKYFEVVESFYLGYLPWAWRNLPRHVRDDAYNTLAMRLALTGATIPFMGIIAFILTVLYLYNGELASRNTFAELKKLEPRLSAWVG